jgi:ribonuclease HII
MTKTLGIDEVGRGPWAGPMVVGACVLGSAEIDGLDDSKKLSAKKREKLAHEIKEKAACVATGWVTSGEIDEMGLSPALKLAARRAVAKIDVDYDEIIIDGTIKLIDDPRVITLPKADGLIKSVSAASIVAKVARDMYMTKLAEKYPNYGFDHHMGYGTAQHQDALQKHGPCPEHRKSFAPVAQLQQGPSLLQKKRQRLTGAIGRRAEDAAAEFLQDKGHTIVDRNWKTKVCEIDIISQIEDEIYFTEVKYRGSDGGGDGLEVIDERKESQMRFAAKVYLEFNEQHQQLQPTISAIALTGEPPKVEAYVPNIDRN